MKRSSACAALCGILLAAVLAGTGCSQAQTTPADQNRAGETAAAGKTAPETDAGTAPIGKTAGETAAETAATGETASETAAIGETAGEEFSKPGEEKDYKGLIVIDPGHQQYGNSDQEPVGPGASQTKAKVSSGTSGVASGVPEYQLTLEISLKLRDELEERDYKVIMCRDTNEIDISNSERADIANDADADAFVRIHANGCGDPGRSGAMTICQTPGNAYNGHLYEKSRALADCILDAYVLATGINYEYVRERRQKNFSYLHKRLGSLNQLRLQPATFMYPLMVENGVAIRKKLQAVKIYIPMLWPTVLEVAARDSLEYKMAENIE